MSAGYAGGSWINAVFDEIALEGLEGTTLNYMWSLLSIRLYAGKPLPDKLQEQIWDFLLRSKKKVSFFEIPEDRPLMQPFKRFDDKDAESGLPVVPESSPFLRLPYAPVHDGAIRGNCADYVGRTPVDATILQEMTLSDVMEIFGQKLVVVASQEERIKALRPANMLLPPEITVQHYIFLECVGRSRYNGETTRGPWSLTNYFKDSSLIFYLRNWLVQQRLVVCQPYTERHNGHSLLSHLVMLPRFFRVYKNHEQRVMEKFYMQIKASPNQYLPSSEILQRIPDLTSSRLKKLLVSHNFRKVFETAMVFPSQPDSADAASTDAASGKATSGTATSGNSTSADAGTDTTSGTATSGNSTSADAASTDTASADSTSGKATSATATSGNSTSADASSTDTTSGKATNGTATSGNSTSADAASGKTTSGTATSGNFTSADAASTDTTSGKATSGTATIADVASTDVASTDAASTDAVIADAISESKSQPKGRKISVVRLRNPNMGFDELSQLDQGDEREEKPPDEILNQRHAYINMPITLECLRAIQHFGNRGMSTLELGQYVAVKFQIARSILKHLMRKKRIKSYTELVGKSRIERFVAVGTEAELILKQKEEQIEKSVQLQCKPELSVPQNMDIVVNDLPNIKANVRPMVFTLKGTDKQTSQHVARKILIVEQIDKTCIIHTMDLVRSIMQSEQNYGSREKICRKSMFRLLQRMQETGVLNVYEVTLEYQQRVRLYRLVTHPKIDAEHELLQREVLRLKNNFHLLAEERKLRPSEQPSKERPELISRKKLRNERQQPEKSRPSAPKLLVACTLHELLFYLVCELKEDQKPLEMNAELLQHWQRTEPSLMAREFLEEWQAEESTVLPYTQEISWRTFIPPLPSYREKPAGWLYFIDALERMPLSLLLHIFRVDRDMTEKLRPILQHPVRQHYLLGQLQLQNLIPRISMQQRFVGTLRLLNNMGLVQVSERQLGRDALQRWVYLNRRTCLLDTTTSTGHNYMRISPDRTYERLTFEFNSREQIADYWAKLQHVCVYTKLGFLKHKERKTSGRKEQRLPPLNFVRTVNFDEALELDDGTVPGDHQGAGGLSSSLFAHQFRHWSWVKRNSVPATRSTATNSRKATAPFPVRKRLSLVRLKPVPRFSKSRVTSSSDARKRKSGPRDDIDRDALRNMRTLRVTWCPAEDRILKMGRAVYLFIDAPLPSLALYNVGTICRDVIRRYLNINNKTTQACVRRLQFLLRMKRDQPDVRNWIYMMQAQPEFNSIYNERFLPQLKQEYPVRSDQIEALLIHFVLILEKLHRMIINEDFVYRQFLLPDNLEDYRIRFRECMPPNGEQDSLLYANPTTEAELQIILVFGVQHSILCSAKDKTLFNLQAFEIYKHFPEDVLNAAFNKARGDSLLVAVKRRNIQHVNRQVSGPGHLLSSKYKYRLVCQKYGYILYDAYYAFEQRFHETPGLARLSLASPNFAQLLLLGEWVAKDWLNLSLQLPVNILNVDTTSMSGKSVASSSDRILDHYSSIFDNAPQTEYSKRLESVCSGRPTARVRFHPANLTYRLQYSVYNQLNKLPMRSMHFFCGLNSLGQSINISCSRLEHGDCPFTCIMQSGNYLNAVERIIFEHRTTLRQLVVNDGSQAPLQLQLDSSTASSTTLSVSTGNLLTLVEQLEIYWRQQQHPQEVKDLGKRLAESTLNRKTDWLALCNELLTYEASKEENGDRHQDYEPSLNKEERARAQDVFVVHLPTIHMEEREHPQLHAKNDELRKAVLDKLAKATYWHYSDNSFETLLPTLQELNYEPSAIQYMRDILDYIQLDPLGVEALELRGMFPLGQFLLDTLHHLEAHDLIKRVGVASYIYVHKAHMRNWVVHTFHIKRLDRERVQSLVATTPATLPAVVGQKRKLLDEESESEQPSSSKKVKLCFALEQNQEQTVQEQNSNEDTDSEESLLPCARRSKRTKRGEVKPKPDSKLETEATRDVIAMRPQPWIRVNASLNRRVLDRWMGALLSECLTRNGCTVQSLFLRFPHLLPVDIMLLLELLNDLGCLQLVELQLSPVHLEQSYDDDFKEQPVTVLYDPKCTYVKVHTDAIGHLTNFIGRKKYSSEFI